MLAQAGKRGRGDVLASQRQSEQDDRTGKYGGGDGALEHEQTGTTPGEDPNETGATPAPGKTHAETKQDRDLASGEENPG